MMTRPLLCLALSLLLASCAQFNTNFLARDSLDGRNNLSAGSLEAQKYLITLMRNGGASGLNEGPGGDAAFKQAFSGGTNILGLIPGTDLAHEYVMIGAHYDHLGTCAQASPGDFICNGATDNAAGVAAVLDLALFFSVPENHPRRSDRCWVPG